MYCCSLDLTEEIHHETILVQGHQNDKRFDTTVYSHLFNKRGGWNKRGGGAKVAKSLNVQVGINVEGGNFLEKTST